MRKLAVAGTLLAIGLTGASGVASDHVRPARASAPGVHSAVAVPELSHAVASHLAKPVARITVDDPTTLGSPTPYDGYCAVWKRRWYDSAHKKWVYTDHSTPAANGSDRAIGGPENIVVKTGDQGHNDSRYGINATDFWVEALGGGGYGSNGYPYAWQGPKNANGEPTPNSDGKGETGEGGVVQGDVHPAGQSVNFSVWSFSLDDEGDAVAFHDTFQGACVQAGGQTVSTGDALNLPTHNVVPHP